MTNQNSKPNLSGSTLQTLTLHSQPVRVMKERIYEFGPTLYFTELKTEEDKKHSLGSKSSLGQK